MKTLRCFGTLTAIAVLICPVMTVKTVVNALTEGDFQYSVNKDGSSVSITGYDGYEKDVVIPAAIDGKTVTEICNSAFGNCSELTTVAIPNSVTCISGGAFMNCSNLMEVTIPDSVIDIGESAFAYCSGLT